MTRTRVARIVLKALAAWLCFTALILVFVIAPGLSNIRDAAASATRGAVTATAVGAGGVGSLAFFASFEFPHRCAEDNRAIFRMGFGLIVIWIALGGTLMWLVRDRFTALAARVRIPWPVKFVVLCIVMALLEEAVTVSMTNLRPVLGGLTDAAHVTASKSYLETVCLHSVIVFVPQFFCWALLLWLWDFKPVEVMLLYGLTGWIMEMLYSGFSHVGEVALWVFVYGLMVYLPAHTAPPDRKAWTVRWWTWPLGVIAGLLAIVLGLFLAPLKWFLDWLVGPLHRLIELP